MPKYTVVHGTLKLSSDRTAQPGDVVELSTEAAAVLGIAVAPEGTPLLKTKTIPPVHAAPKKPEAPAPTPEPKKVSK